MAVLAKTLKSFMIQMVTSSKANKYFDFIAHLSNCREWLCVVFEEQCIIIFLITK